MYSSRNDIFIDGLFTRELLFQDSGSRYKLFNELKYIYVYIVVGVMTGRDGAD